MKKFNLFLICIEIILSISFISCNTSFTNHLDSSSYVLPNGYKLSEDEQSSLKQFAISKGFLDESGRAIESMCSDENIQEMIDSLIDEFGDAAYNYFGEFEVAEQPEETDSSRKAGSIFKGMETLTAELKLSDEYAKQYDAFFKIYNYKVSWGLWWYKYKNINGYVYGRTKYTTNTFGLICTSIQWNYTDSVTDKKGNESDTCYCYVGASKTKYGWLPEMNANLTATITHPWMTTSSIGTAKIICK